MKTFKQDTVLGNIPNEQIYVQLIEYARSKGVPVFKNVSAETYRRGYVNLIFHTGDICGNSSSYGTRDRTWITFEQFFEYCDNWQKFKPVKVFLNNHYDAVITDGKVIVGCQTFEFSAIEALYNEIKKINP